jgi:hypothetical protein
MRPLVGHRHHPMRPVTDDWCRAASRLCNRSGRRDLVRARRARCRLSRSSPATRSMPQVLLIFVVAVGTGYRPGSFLLAGGWLEGLPMWPSTTPTSGYFLNSGGGVVRFRTFREALFLALKRFWTFTLIMNRCSVKDAMSSALRAAQWRGHRCSGGHRSELAHGFHCQLPVCRSANSRPTPANDFWCAENGRRSGKPTRQRRTTFLN